MKLTSFNPILLLTIAAWLVFNVSAQTSAQDDLQAAFDEDYSKYRAWAMDDDTSALQVTDNPELQTFIDIAEHARRKIFTPENNELRKMAREFDEKLLAIQTSDLGRWVATQPDMVITFGALDGEIIFLTDAALEARRNRLQASIDALNRYTPETQGKFDPAINPAVSTILKDANWVEENYRKLSTRMALMADLETNFPADEDWSNHPTLREQKQARSARQLAKDVSAVEKGRARALDEMADLKEQSAFARESKLAKAKIQGQDKLAEIQLKLMESENLRKGAELEKELREKELEKEKIESDTVHMTAEAKKKLLVEYLASPRVTNLLAPFCSKGRTAANSGAGRKQVDAVTAVPMSLSRLSRYNCFTAKHRNMRALITIANNRGNDRPGWPTTEHDYFEAGETFKNMDGVNVNPYVEAQRILREHGAVLVELGMLRN